MDDKATAYRRRVCAGAIEMINAVTVKPVALLFAHLRFRLNLLLGSFLGSFLLVALVSSFLWIFARSFHGMGDEGLLITPAEKIQAGQIPYLGFFSELAPGTFYIQALWFKMFGTHIWSARIPMLLVMAAIGWQIFYLSRKLMSNLAATIPVLIYSVMAFTRWMVVSHHWYSLFFALAATILLVQFLQKGQNSKLFLAGLGTFASGMCMQSKGAFCLLAVICVLMMAALPRGPNGWRLKLARVTYYLGGVFFLAPIPLLYFYRHNALDELFYSTVTYLWQNYLPYDYQSFPFLPSNLWRGVLALAGDFSMVRFGKFFSTTAWSILIPGAAVCAFTVSRRPHGLELGREQRCPLIVTYLIMGFGLNFSEMHRYDFVHMLFGTPLILVMAVWLLYNLGFQRTPGSKVAAGFLFCVTLFFIAHGLSLALRESRRVAPINTRRGTFFQTAQRAERYQIIIDEVQHRVSQNSGVFFYPYSSILYFLTGTSNPTRLDYLLPGQTTPAQFEEVIQLLKGDAAPPFIFSFWKECQKGLPHFFPNVPIEKFQSHPIEEFLLKDESPYRKVFENGSFIIFKHFKLQ